MMRAPSHLGHSGCEARGSALPGVNSSNLGLRPLLPSPHPPSPYTHTRHRRVPTRDGEWHRPCLSLRHPAVRGEARRGVCRPDKPRGCGGGEPHDIIAAMTDDRLSLPAI